MVHLLQVISSKSSARAKLNPAVLLSIYPASGQLPLTYFAPSVPHAACCACMLHLRLRLHLHLHKPVHAIYPFQ
jgi:hypothetical protein